MLITVPLFLVYITDSIMQKSVFSWNTNKIPFEHRMTGLIIMAFKGTWTYLFQPSSHSPHVLTFSCTIHTHVLTIPIVFNYLSFLMLNYS